jgi:prepilin-type N-terminal cleavage/methylation domain-containing protein
MKRNNRGLTFVELMIVIGIIAFLAVLISVYLRSQIYKSYDARRKAEIKRISIAVEEYEKDNNCYPLPSALSCTIGTGLRPYLEKVPCDPMTGASYMYEHEDSTCPRWYKIYSVLNNESDSDYVTGIGPNSAFNYVSQSPNAPSNVSNGGGGGGGGGGTAPETDFYGCFSGVCTLIQWDTDRPGPSCDPNFQNSTCYGQCANLANECADWNQ